MIEQVAKAEYQAILQQDSRLLTWYQFHTVELPEILQRDNDRRQIGNIVHATVRTKYRIRREIPLPDVHWIISNSAVVNITGNKFPVPVLIFGGDYQGLFSAITDDAGGETTRMPMEFISRGQISTLESIDSNIVLMPSPTRPSRAIYRERFQHELTHAVDPLISLRVQDGVTLSELIAIVGSFSDSDSRFSGLTLHPPFIVPYLIEQLASQGVREIATQDFESMVNTINSLVYNMTHTYPKIPNDRITRKLMACRNLNQLKASWPEVFPRENDEGEDIVILD